MICVLNLCLNIARETLKHQKQRLKATVNLMKRPSMSLIPRNLVG